MRIEFRVGFVLIAINLLIKHLLFLPNFAIEFVQGMTIALGLLLMIISQLPEKTYNNLLYRKLLTDK